MLVTSPCYLSYLTYFSRGNHLKSVVARLSWQRYLVTPVTSIFLYIECRQPIEITLLLQQGVALGLTNEQREQVRSHGRSAAFSQSAKPLSPSESKVS